MFVLILRLLVMLTAVSDSQETKRSGVDLLFWREFLRSPDLMLTNGPVQLKALPPPAEVQRPAIPVLEIPCTIL
jgi:hypothetical protein